MEKSIIKIYPHFLLSILVSVSLHAAQSKSPTVTFSGEDFIHRWSQANQHEYTPEGQENLSAWEDMVTVVHYPDSGSGEALAKIANNLLGLYRQHGGKVIITDSKPRTKDKEAEHLIAVALPQAGFVEIAFARLAIEKHEAYSIVYSHRIYGNNVDDEVERWIKQHAQKTKQDVMSMPLGLTVSPTR